MLCHHSDNATSVWGPRDDGTLAMEDMHRDMQIGEGSGELEVGHQLHLGKHERSAETEAQALPRDLPGSKGGAHT